jgi:hypothetical protein
MRTLLNNYDYGSANLPMSDGRFISSLNEFRPSEYPEFGAADVLAANPGENAEFVHFKNNASGLCMDITDANMSDGTNVIQWDCEGENWQRWYLKSGSGLIRSLQDPRFCLDNSSVFGDGANIIIWTCHGGDSQLIVDNGDGSYAMDSDNDQVLDGDGTSAGDNVQTCSNWGGENQLWTLVPRTD